MQLTQHIKRASIFRWPLFVALMLVPLLGGCSGGGFTVAGFVEQLILGLILGSVYALIALGYTLVYGVIKLINFAHGDIYMLGAFIGFYSLRLSIRWLNFTYDVSLIWCWIVSVLFSVLLCALIAVIMERLAYKPLRGSSRIAALITAVGVSFLLENAGIIVFGPNPKSYEPKTFAVYQVQLAEDPEFNDPKQFEIYDTTSKSFGPGDFEDTTYARVKVLTVDGESAFSPVLMILPDQKNALAEYQIPKAEQTDVTAINMVSFSRKESRISWAEGDFEFTQMNSIFSDKDGEQLAFRIPIKTTQEAALKVPVFNVVIVAVTLLLLWGLNQLINKSMFGISMRALSFDSDAAKLMGVNTDKCIAQTFAIGGACAAIAGNMIGVYNQAIEPLMGILPGLKAFVAAVVGGIGSIPGAAVGGLIMGVSEALVKGNIDPAWSSLSDALAFAILIVVLLFKPSGIFGSALKEKV